MNKNYLNQKATWKYMFLLCFVSICNFSNGKGFLNNRFHRYLEENVDVSAEQSPLDSILNLLKTAKEDTNKVIMLLQVSDMCDEEDILKYAESALALANKLNYQKGIGDAYINIAYIHNMRGEIFKAVDLWEKSLVIETKFGDENKAAIILNNLATVYQHQGDVPMALQYYSKALKMQEKIGDKESTGHLFLNIGSVYEDQKDYLKALENYLKSLALYEEIQKDQFIAGACSRLGPIYRKLNNPIKEKEYLYRNLKLSEKNNYKRTKAQALKGLSKLEFDAKNYKEAEGLLSQAVEVQKETKDLMGLGYIYVEYGALYKAQQKSDAALHYYQMAFDMGKQLNNPLLIKFTAFELSDLNVKRGNYKEAYNFYTLYNQMSDSVVNSENQKAVVTTQLRYEFDKQQSLQKAEQDKKDVLAKAELKRNEFQKNAYLGGLGLVMVFSGIFYNRFRVIRKQKKTIEIEKDRGDKLLLNILPHEIAEELKQNGYAKAKRFDNVTVLFTDFKNFTNASMQMSAEELVNEINYCYSGFDEIITRYGIEKIKTIGDSYMCAGGLPTTNSTHPEDVVMAALEMLKFIENRKQQTLGNGSQQFEVRIGIHSGPVVAGIVGVKKYAYDIWSDTVNIAARIEQNSEAGKITISETTYELVKDKFLCTHRGKIEAKNKGEIDMYFVDSIN